MIPFIEPMLYLDPQNARPVCLCQRCGGECYHESLLCYDCEERP